MATFVIVHGAFGGGWEWRAVAVLLRARGHEVFTPSLTGHGNRVHLAAPEIGLETHIQDIVNLIQFEDLHQVVLACQSYGGMVITGVADQIAERLSHLIYLNALVPQDGQSAFDLLPSAIRQRFEKDAQTHGDGWLVPVPSFENDPVVAAFARGRYVASPLRMFTDPIKLDPNHTRLPRTFIWCTDDPQGLAGVADFMRLFAERAQSDPDWEFYQLNSPPDAFIHMPDTVADLFDKVGRSS